jgi:hypothetical protein
MADIFTDVGENWVADLFDGTVSPPANYFIGWGTGAGTAAKGDTTLFTEETTDGRQSATESQPASNQNRFVATITASAARAITNAGLFDVTDPGGNLILKSDFATINLANTDSIEFTFTITWS